MQHLILAFYLCALLAGTASLSQTLLLWQRHRKLVIRRYAYFLLALYLVLCGFLVDLYTRIVQVSTTIEARSIIWIFQAGGCTLYIFICPYFFHSLTGLAVPKWQRIMFFSLDAVVVAAALASIALPDFEPFSIALSGILFAMIVYGIVYLAIRLRDIGEKTLRRALAIFLGVSAVFFPLMLIDSAMSFVPVLRIFRFMNNMAQPLYFLVLNCLTIAFGLRYLNRPAYAEKDRLTGYFLRAFGVTGRETQIIGQLLDGASTKIIAKKLFISPKTAENHIYNIYQKLGVRNRVQMFQLIKTNSLE
jgi:DNA-binding CsgD family transcriptional regulator